MALSKDSTKQEIYSELLKRTGYKDDQIIEAYMYGSRVYGNSRSDSDWDFIVIVKANQIHTEQFSDNLINVNFYYPYQHHQRINEHEPSAMECVFLPEQFIIKMEHPDFYKSFKPDLVKLRHSFSAKSSNSWVKAKKKLTVPESYNDSVGKKSLWHSIRIIDFGIQIATNGFISNYGSCNDFYDEIMYCNDWSELFEKYKKRYNAILTEFRKHAKKE